MKKAKKPEKEIVGHVFSNQGVGTLCVDKRTGKAWWENIGNKNAEIKTEKATEAGKETNG